MARLGLGYRTGGRRTEALVCEHAVSLRRQVPLLLVAVSVGASLDSEQERAASEKAASARQRAKEYRLIARQYAFTTAYRQLLDGTSIATAL